jgi:hypothetical protein
MKMKFSICTFRKSTILGRLVLLLILSLCTVHLVSAEVVELTITGYWSDKDIKVTNGSDKSYNLADPKFDGKIFGIAPAAGDLSLRLLVNTNGVIFFPKGTTFTTDRTGTYSLSHDFYGYKQVTLVDETYSFGSATWKSDGILTGLEGPSDTKAALWTDVDLTQADPARISFRMFGQAPGLTTDLFIGSRTPFSIGPQFLLWEYYKGEEIRSSKYTAKSKVLGS